MVDSVQKNAAAMQQPFLRGIGLAQTLASIRVARMAVRRLCNRRPSSRRMFANKSEGPKRIEHNPHSAPRDKSMLSCLDARDSRTSFLLPTGRVPIGTLPVPASSGIPPRLLADLRVVHGHDPRFKNADRDCPGFTQPPKVWPMAAPDWQAPDWRVCPALVTRRSSHLWALQSDGHDPHSLPPTHRHLAFPQSFRRPRRGPD